MGLEQLPSELLYYIFEFLNINDLIALSQCNHFLQNLITSSIVGNKLLVTNQLCKIVKRRSILPLSVREKLLISANWQYGKYRDSLIFTTGYKCMPWIQLSKNCLLASHGENIEIFRRSDKKYLHNNYIPKNINRFTFHGSDVIKFSYKSHILEKHVVAGYRGGHICVWNLSSNLFKTVCLQDQSDVNSVDVANKQLLASGSKSGHVTLHSIKNLESLHSFIVGDHIWSVSFSENAEKLAVGTAKYNQNVPPINIFDVKSTKIVHKFGSDFPKGSGTLDIDWLDNNTLFTGGYDTDLRKWDLRVGKCVRTWEDPFNSTIYCLKTDGAFTVLTGTQSHGKIHLWDIRQTKCVQVYYLYCCAIKRFNSPVYSLAFDSCQMFAATDKYLSVLDFISNKEPARDYRKFMSWKM